MADGDFRGDIELRVRGLLSTPVVVGDPEQVLVGVVWLDYDALTAPSTHLALPETSTVPIVSFALIHFTFDLLDKPPSVGNYRSAQGDVIPWSIRLGRLILFVDTNGDRSFAMNADGTVAAPDRILAASDETLLLFAQTRAPGMADERLLAPGQDARSGYQLIQRMFDPSAPNLLGQVVVDDTPVVFGAPGAGNEK